MTPKEQPAMNEFSTEMAANSSVPTWPANVHVMAPGLLTKGSEDGWSSKVPQFLGLDPKLSKEDINACHRRNVIFIGRE